MAKQMSKCGLNIPHKDGDLTAAQQLINFRAIEDWANFFASGESGCIPAGGTGGISVARYDLSGVTLSADDTWYQVPLSEDVDADAIGAVSSNVITVTKGTNTLMRLTAYVPFGEDSEGSIIQPTGGNAGYGAGFAIDATAPEGGLTDREEWDIASGASSSITFGEDASYEVFPDAHPDSGWLEISGYGSTFTVETYAYSEDVTYISGTGVGWLCIEMQ